MAKKKAVSDSYLNHWWRKAVISRNYNSCALCGRSYPHLECHHIVKRSRVITRWDYRNGISLCVACHKRLHEAPWEIVMEDVMDLDYLEKMMQYTYKEYLVKEGISDAEFRRAKLEELKQAVAEVL